eukprot:GFUD01041388.1.p1 GENE.GFUD01041388.1~~GFUD01041388.1.p1  ORF type:complete len:304 (-),score=65.76 GFUD01041388.1:95-1006(-)
MALLFDKVALITGASRGVGYAAAKKLCEKFPGATIYLTTKNSEITPALNKQMKDDFAGSSEHCEYLHLDVTNTDNIAEIKELIKTRHETLDILINNAGVFLVPDTSSPEVFGHQATSILGANYWGVKNMVNGLQDIFTPAARLVNMSSHLGHLSLINGEAKQSLHLREMLASPDLSEKDLDGMMKEFETLAGKGGWVAAGWPNCAYTVSKVGINAYTRVLQKRFDEEGNEVVVNSIHAGTKHSKIHQASVISMEDGAYAVANCACVPAKGLKGAILWHNLTPIIWEDAIHKPSLVDSAATNHN